VKPIMPNTVSLTAHVTEEDLRARLVLEVLDNAGALNPDGTIPKGIISTVHRGIGRADGYTITITGPAPARLALAKPGDPA
jgi:hypothetical protein